MWWWFSCSIVSDSLRLHGLQHARLPCPSPTPRACSNSCPSSQWCHPTFLSSVILFSSCLQSFPASGSFPMSWLFTSGGQSIGASASASVLPLTIQGWFPACGAFLKYHFAHFHYLIIWVKSTMFRGRFHEGSGSLFDSLLNPQGLAVLEKHHGERMNRY